MAAAIFFLVIVVVIGVIGINLYLRSWVREESKREAHLRDPHTHTVAYAIPNGMDPATIESALARAGLTSGVDRGVLTRRGGGCERAVVPGGPLMQVT